MSDSVVERLRAEVIAPGICTGCGACVALAPAGQAAWDDTPNGPLPRFTPQAALPALAWDVCPGRGVPYAELYRKHYGKLPENWLAGCFEAVRTGYAADPVIRRHGASGGVTTQVLLHLLETGRIDAAIVVRQGVPTPEQASPVVARTAAEIQAAAQSVYIPVPVLAILAQLEPGLRYAMTCLPDQAAVLRRLQHAGHPAARQIRYVLGPYTGTALAPGAVTCYLRSKGIRPGTDRVTSLKWRAGEWPGYMEIVMASGKVFRTPKVYYNFLIPFFVTQSSLQGMDFANEFCDLSVGDAWSPRFEALGGGHSVIVTRTAEMEAIVREMEARGALVTEAADPLRTLEMHGHMLDFKKRGSYIRNAVRRRLGLRAPDHGLRPTPLPVSRVVVELVIMLLFAVGRTRLARGCVARVPETLIGPLFNRLRLGWKALSKPTKRKGLGELKMVEMGPHA